jgi:threonine dehydrogenase-like Zn-dependent dehydrogenase
MPVFTPMAREVDQPGEILKRVKRIRQFAIARAADLAAAAVLKNNVVVGSVNANKRHWYKAVQALARADRSWLNRLITRRVRPEEFARALQKEREDIKVIIQFGEA